MINKIGTVNSKYVKEIAAQEDEGPAFAIGFAAPDNNIEEEDYDDDDQ